MMPTLDSEQNGAKINRYNDGSGLTATDNCQMHYTYRTLCIAEVSEKPFINLNILVCNFIPCSPHLEHNL